MLNCASLLPLRCEFFSDADCPSSDYAHSWCLLIDPAKFISAALPFLQSCGLPCTFLEERGLVLSPIVVLESRCFGVAMQCGFRGIGLPTLI